MTAPDQGLLNLGHSIEPSNTFTMTREGGLRYRSLQDEGTTRKYFKQRRLREYLQELGDREKASQHQNRQLLQQFEKVEKTLRVMMTRTAAMKTIRMEYERYLEENYPRWQQELQVKTEAAQRKMMEDCLKMFPRNTEEQVQQKQASKGRDINSGSEPAGETIHKPESDWNQEGVCRRLVPSHQPTRLHQAELGTGANARYDQDGEHSYQALLATGLTLGSTALRHLLTTRAPAGSHELDVQPVRLSWSSEVGGDGSRRSEEQERKASSSPGSSSTSGDIVVSPAARSETAENRRLSGVEQTDRSSGDDQSEDEEQSRRSSDESGPSSKRQETRETETEEEEEEEEEEEDGKEDEEEEDGKEDEDVEESLPESEGVSLGRHTTEDEDTDEEEDEVKSEEDEENGEKTRQKDEEESEDDEEVEERDEEGEEVEEPKGDEDDSDDIIVAPKTRSRKLLVIPEVSENEDKSDKESSDEELNESSDDDDDDDEDDIERLLAPELQTLKDSEAKVKATHKIFQVEQRESPDPQIHSYSFYD